MNKHIAIIKSSFLTFYNILYYNNKWKTMRFVFFFLVITLYANNIIIITLIKVVRVIILYILYNFGSHPDHYSKYNLSVDQDYTYYHFNNKLCFQPWLLVVLMRFWETRRVSARNTCPNYKTPGFVYFDEMRPPRFMRIIIVVLIEIFQGHEETDSLYINPFLYKSIIKIIFIS